MEAVISWYKREQCPLEKEGERDQELIKKSFLDVFLIKFNFEEGEPRPLLNWWRGERERERERAAMRCNAIRLNPSVGLSAFDLFFHFWHFSHLLTSLVLLVVISGTGQNKNVLWNGEGIEQKYQKMMIVTRFDVPWIEFPREVTFPSLSSRRRDENETRFPFSNFLSHKTTK